MAGETKTFTQEQVDTLVAERLATEVAGLKNNQAEALKEAKAAKAKLAAYEGVDPEEFKRLKAAAEEAEQKRLKGEGDFKTLEQQLVTKYEAKVEAERSTATRYRSSLEQYLIDAEAMRVLAEYSDSPALLLPHVKARMKVMEQDGTFAARIVDQDGNVRIGKGQGSAPMTLTELMDEMKQDKQFALAFKGTGSSGGGAAKSSGGAAGGHVTRIAAPANGVLGKDFLQNLDGLSKGTVTLDG